MPLPPAGSPWPLPSTVDIAEQVRIDAAWYGGERAELNRIYGREGDDSRPSTRARLWGRTPPLGQRDTRMHVPVPADLATMSADLLFADPPKLTAPKPAGDAEPNTAAQDRLDEIEDAAGLANTWLEGAEIAAALGGVALKVDWSRETGICPTVSVVHADDVLPEYAFGVLVGVLVHREAARNGATVLRYMEYHRAGGIEMALYDGSDDNVGRVIPLTDTSAPAWVRALAVGLTDGNVKPTGTQLLTCRYVPNMRPNRGKLRGAVVGRSDLKGLADQFDAIDEAWSSWLRDVRLAKARLTIPAGFLERVGRGQGATFDGDRELYAELNMPPDSTSPSRGLELYQPEIRYEAHMATVEQLVRTVLRSAGYSAQTFGLGDDGGSAAMTAAEVGAKERRSITTRGRKSRYWVPEMRLVLAALLAIDKAAGFPGSVDPGDRAPEVELSPIVSEDPKNQAETLSLLAAAGAISTLLKVQTLHPDWDEAQVEEEVARIQEEAAPPPLEDPTSFGGGSKEPPAGDGPAAK